MTKRMLAAIAEPALDILGHMTGRKVAAAGEGDKGTGRPHRPPSTFDLDKVIAPASNTARPSRSTAAGPARPAETDADRRGRGRLPVQHRHRRARAGPARLAAVRLRAGALCGVPGERVVNTWTIDRLLAWTASHGGNPCRVTRPLSVGSARGRIDDLADRYVAEWLSSTDRSDLCRHSRIRRQDRRPLAEGYAAQAELTRRTSTTRRDRAGA